MKRAFLVAGLAWGDEGKGATVDYLTHQYQAGLVVRYNGGSQAGHNVVTPDGRHHTFQQFGAGIFHPGVRTHLSRFMLINPMNQMREEEHLVQLGINDAWQRTTVDPCALIITPFHRELNRLIMAQNGEHNSCGHGVGVCRNFNLLYADHSLYAGDLAHEDITRKKLRVIRDQAFDVVWLKRWKCPDILRKNEEAIDLCWGWYGDWIQRIDLRETKEVLAATDSTVIFEGAQGVLLDENHGEPNFNTWTDTTFNNAHQLLGEAGYLGEYTRVGVVRSYYTRHGDGPFPTENPDMKFPEPHNEDDCPQGKFRRGLFDYHLFNKALEITGGIDWLAINHLDQCLMYESIRNHKTIVGLGPTYNDREEI